MFCHQKKAGGSDHAWELLFVVVYRPVLQGWDIHRWQILKSCEQAPLGQWLNLVISYRDQCIIHTLYKLMWFLKYFCSQMCSGLAKWHSYLPITLITQGCKLVWIKIDTAGPSMKQHNSDPTDDIWAELNSSYDFPKTHYIHSLIPKTVRMFFNYLNVDGQYLWKPFLFISAETVEDSSICFRRTQWFFFSSTNICRLYWARP